MELHRNGQWYFGHAGHHFPGSPGRFTREYRAVVKAVVKAVVMAEVRAMRQGDIAYGPANAVRITGG
ncbi:hypothetical protein [Streptomyces sp. NPDC048340]|uniref:hypothetical protein n=1 Tax=Streptomyces sp. NPDC048340 TaxID=3365537 RepID=UPI003714F28C